MLGRKGLSYKLYIKRDTCSTTPPLTTLHSSLTPYCSNTPDDSHHLALASPLGTVFLSMAPSPTTFRALLKYHLSKSFPDNPTKNLKRLSLPALPILLRVMSFSKVLNTIGHMLFHIYLFTCCTSPKLEIEWKFHKDGILVFFINCCIITFTTMIGI